MDSTHIIDERAVCSCANPPAVNCNGILSKAFHDHGSTREPPCAAVTDGLGADLTVDSRPSSATLVAGA